MLRKPQSSRLLARKHRSVIAIAALLAILPMLVRGSSCGHDFDFHLLSWLEAAQQFAQGSFPHWAYTPAFNAGEPRFIFYPPLSWSLGAFLGLFLPWTLVPAAFTWIALTVSGLTFHAVTRSYTSSSAATLGAVLYLANPYMLFTAYERSAFAELLAAAWLPLLLAGALAARPTVLAVAAPLALLWLTNAPAAVMSTYALAFLTLVRLAMPSAAPNFPHTAGENSRTRPRIVLTTATGTALGLALAAFYILPAAYERRFVQIQMLVIEGMRVSDHFLFHRMPGPTPDDRFHDAVVRAASLIALALLGAIAAALLALTHKARSTRATAAHASAPARPNTLTSSQLGEAALLSFVQRRRNSQISLSSRTQTILPLTLITLLIAFLLTPVSLPVWTHLPDLAFLQFPWRLNALLGLIFAFLTTLALPWKPPNLPSPILPLASLLAAMLLIAPAWHLFHQSCDPEDSVPAQVALFHSSLGTDPTDEYTPIDADPEALHPRDPPFWLIPVPSHPAAAAVNQSPLSTASPGPAPHHLTLALQTSEYLVLNLRDYPAWHIFLNKTPLQPTAPQRLAHRDDGLIVILLPPGTDTIDVALARTPDESLGLLISTLALLFALFLYFKPRGTAQAPSPSGTFLSTPA